MACLCMMPKQLCQCYEDNYPTSPAWCTPTSPLYTPPASPPDHPLDCGCALCPSPYSSADNISNAQHPVDCLCESCLDFFDFTESLETANNLGDVLECGNHFTCGDSCSCISMVFGKAGEPTLQRDPSKLQTKSFTIQDGRFNVGVSTSATASADAGESNTGGRCKKPRRKAKTSPKTPANVDGKPKPKRSYVRRTRKIPELSMPVSKVPG